MDKSLMRECFHNCLDVAPREDDFLVPSRYTPMQCAFYDKIPYASFMGTKARMSAGITLEFDTNAPAFTLQWKIVGGYPLDSADRDSTLDVYVNDVLVAQQTHLRTLPWNEMLESSFDLGEGRKRVVVFLPHLLIFALGDIVLPEGNFYLAPVPKRTARVLMIGDSITHNWEGARGPGSPRAWARSAPPPATPCRWAARWAASASTNPSPPCALSPNAWITRASAPI